MNLTFPYNSPRTLISSKRLTRAPLQLKSDATDPEANVAAGLSIDHTNQNIIAEIMIRRSVVEGAREFQAARLVFEDQGDR